MDSADYQMYLDMKCQVRGCISELRAMRQADLLPVQPTSSHGGGTRLGAFLEGKMRQIDSDYFQVAVLGDYSSGKSSLINVLLRLIDPVGNRTAGYLPTEVAPTTAVITRLFYGDPETIHLVLDDGQRIAVSYTDLKAYLCEPKLRSKKFPWPHDPEWHDEIAAKIARVELGCSVPLLKKGVRIVDTPGLGSVHKEHSALTLDYATEIDAALFLIPCDRPMGESEATCLQQIKASTDKLIFVQTKRELGDAPECGEQIYLRHERENRLKIDKILPRGDYPYYHVSAAEAADAIRKGQPELLEVSGITALERFLETFLTHHIGASRIDEWVLRAEYAVNLIDVEINREYEDLQSAGDANSAPDPSEDDYQAIDEMCDALDQELQQISRNVLSRFDHVRPEFVQVVGQDAVNYLNLVTPAELRSVDGRLRLARGIIRSIQTHSQEKLQSIADDSLEAAKAACRVAFDKPVPPALRVHLNSSFKWSQPFDLPLGNILTTRTYSVKTPREGLIGRVIDWWSGVRTTTRTEEAIDLAQIQHVVAVAAEDSFRDARSSVKQTLTEAKDAIINEMGRMVQAAQEAAERSRVRKEQSERGRAESLRQNREDVDQLRLIRSWIDAIKQQGE